MEIIEELEPTGRGIYGGAVGYISYQGNVDLAIAIRTVVTKGDRFFVQAGAGLVADSEPVRAVARLRDELFSLAGRGREILPARARAAMLRHAKLLGYNRPSSLSIRASRDLYAACVQAADDKAFYVHGGCPLPSQPPPAHG